MNITQDLSVHAALSTAYENEFGNNRLQDAVWSQVHRISLHCLTTGIMILEGAGDAKYCRIPPEDLARLKTASDTPNQLSAFAATLMRRLREDLASFSPQFKVVVLNGPLDTYRYIWKMALKSYTLDEKGFPICPQDIYDVVFRQFQNYGVVAQVLVKDENPHHAQAKAVKFLEEEMQRISTYNKQIKEVLEEYRLEPADANGQKIAVAINATRVWAFKIAILKDPNFKAYIEDVYVNNPHANTLIAQVLAELKQLL